MARIGSDQLIEMAKHVHQQFKKPVYFHIPEKHVVDREALVYSHMYVAFTDDLRFNIPVYTFNNKLYLHTNITHTLGEGHKIGPASSSGAHYYPMEE